MILGYDFEVFYYDWMVVIIDPETESEYKFINDPDGFIDFYNQHINDIWVGFNNRHYDQWIAKGIISGFDPWDINDHIINKGLAGWEFSSVLNKVFMINYDVMPLNKSLKQLEGFQGHNIHESNVPFDINRELTYREIEETIKYCRNDVIETLNVLAANINDFTALMGLIKEFNLPLSYMSKTKAQISAEILQCDKVERTDEFELFTLDCLRLSDTKRWLTVKKKKRKNDDASGLDLPIGKVFMRPDQFFFSDKYQDYRLYFETDIANVPHIFAWGGLHGGVKKYHYRIDADHLLIHVDVASYYPSLMIYHNLLTRSAKHPELFREIYEKRLTLKHAGKKAEQAPLKIVLNGTYGICKDSKNKAYDPRNANLICINGQLLLLDLIEKLEQIPSFELVQSNTDGLIVKVHRRDFEKLDDTCYEWESRTKMALEFDYIREIWQKDVNNYVFVQMDGKIERKGAYVKELNSMDNDLPIVNKALVDYMLHGTPVEETINNADQLIDFQKICKLTNKYNYVRYGGRVHFNKCYRVFASTDPADGGVFKIKTDKQGDSENYSKFSNTSLHSFVENGDITDMKVPPKLDKKFYIDLAKRRLEQYGC